MIMEILNVCMGKGCQVRTVKEGYRLGDDIQSKVLAFAFGLSAEIERNLISQRTKEALARRRAEGVELGHHTGYRCALNRRCIGMEEVIGELLAVGVSKSQIARSIGVSRDTLYRYLRYTGRH